MRPTLRAARRAIASTEDAAGAARGFRLETPTCWRSATSCSRASSSSRPSLSRGSLAEYPGSIYSYYANFELAVAHDRLGHREAAIRYCRTAASKTRTAPGSRRSSKSSRVVPSRGLIGLASLRPPTRRSAEATCRPSCGLPTHFREQQSRLTCMGPGCTAVGLTGWVVAAVGSSQSTRPSQSLSTVSVQLISAIGGAPQSLGQLHSSPEPGTSRHRSTRQRRYWAISS